MSKYWPLIKVLPITTNFRFVAFSRIAAIVSAVAVVVSLGFTLFPFEPPWAGRCWRFPPRQRRWI